MWQYLLDILSYTISCLEFPDCIIRFPLALERPCSWKHILISTWLPLNNLPCVPSHKTLDFIIHCLEVFIRVLIAIKIPIMDHIYLTFNIINILLYAAHRKNNCRIFLLPFGSLTWQSSIPDIALHLRWSIRILAQIYWEHKMVSYKVLVAHPYDILINLIQ